MSNEVSKRYAQRGVSASKEDVHNAIKNIDKHIDQNEHLLITLVDEYYDENDFKDFCHSISNINFSIMAAIKKFNFPEEYLKNYAVIIDEENQIITNSIEKSKKIVSDFFGTGLICVNKNFTELVVKNISEDIKTPLFSLLSESKIPRYHILKNIYCNINTRVDIYQLEKEIRKNKKFTIDTSLKLKKKCFHETKNKRRTCFRAT